MSTLYLDRQGLELRADGPSIALYEAGERVRTVPMALLDRVVVHGDVVLSTALIGRLAECGVGFVVLSRRNARRTATLLGRPHGDARIRAAQYRWSQEPGTRLTLSRRLMVAKLDGQARLLARALAERPDRRRELTQAADAVRGLAARVDGAESLETLLGLEGAAAAAYFQGLRALLPESLGFTGRNRRPPRDPVNAALSLGYTLVHFEAVRAAHGAGLDPLIGFYHGMSHGRESLAADLLEPLRSHVDGWVWKLFRGRTLRADHFATDKGACLLRKAGRRGFYVAYEAFARPVRRLLRLQCRALVRTLMEESAP